MLRLKRESFASRIGFLMVSAGCAIGIGNVWRFPTVTGQYGGGVFVLFYLLFLVLMGAPVLTMELAVGRAGHGSAGTAYRALEPKGSKWHLHGWACLIGCCVLMMYYTTVSGWMLAYFFRFVKGTFTGLAADAVSGVYADLLADPFEQIVWMAITVLLGFFVCSRGLQNGIERIGKWMMGALFVLILVLAVHSFVLPGAGEGLAFYLLPDWNRAAEMGIGNVIVAAMNQAFFTLSLGVGAMEIFGSYMSRDYTLAGESLRICALDTCVAICSGLIIFPACFSYGVSPDAGPKLIFITLPNVFANMAGGPPSPRPSAARRRRCAGGFSLFRHAGGRRGCHRTLRYEYGRIRLPARGRVKPAGDCFRSFHKYPLFIRAVLYYNKTTNMKK